MIEIAFYFKSQGTEKLELFSFGVYNFPNLGSETLVNADYDCAKISIFAILRAKLSPKKTIFKKILCLQINEFK